MACPVNQLCDDAQAGGPRRRGRRDRTAGHPRPTWRPRPRGVRRAARSAQRASTWIIALVVSSAVGSVPVRALSPDKPLHAVAGAAVTSVGYGAGLATLDTPWQRAALAFGCGVVATAGKELLDAAGFGQVEAADAAWGVGGAALAALATWALDRASAPPRRRTSRRVRQPGVAESGAAVSWGGPPALRPVPARIASWSPRVPERSKQARALDPLPGVLLAHLARAGRASPPDAGAPWASPADPPTTGRDRRP